MSLVKTITPAPKRHDNQDPHDATRRTLPSHTDGPAVDRALDSPTAAPNEPTAEPHAAAVDRALDSPTAAPNEPTAAPHSPAVTEPHAPAESQAPAVAEPQAAPAGQEKLAARPLTIAEVRARVSPEEWEQRRAVYRHRIAGGIDLPILFWVVAVHTGAVAALFYFTWQALALTLFLGWLTGGVGICLGYHRLLTHQSFRTYRPVKWLIALIGSLAGEGSAVHWVANHRKHHALSDEVGDPHSPIDGGWWSHMLWFLPQMRGQEYVEYNRRWAPDIARDGVLVFLDRTYLLWHILFGLMLCGIGYWIGGSYMATSFVLWGMFVRLVYVLHSTWLVNSATHMWGYRNYETTDHSRNLWWVALLTYGEGWHNNHHAYPRMARHGHKWWEIDVTFSTIRLLQRLGLAWDVVDYKHRHGTGH